MTDVHFQTDRSNAPASSKAPAVRVLPVAYKLAIVGCLIGALVLPIATVNVSVRSFIESILQTWERPFTIEQVERMLAMARVSLPEDEQTSYNVFQAVQSLLAEGHLLASAIVAIGSVVLPILKGASGVLSKTQGRLWALTRAVSGRFALLDVLVVAVLVVAVSTVTGWSMSVGPAAWFYLGFALLCAFPPRSTV